MAIERVRRSYGARAAEYTELLGSVNAMTAEDRQLITAWAATVRGRALDAGCGPGHWTAFLAEHGVAVDGVDLVPEFVAIATARFPHLRFRVGDLEALEVADDALGGILSWYSVIHTEPERVPGILGEFARCLRPGGTLLLGFATGPRSEPFDHAVVTAYFWPVDAMAHELVGAGFEIVESRTRTDPGSRPHAAILARRSEPTAS
ncbi:class I SAM-dependent methyltransferase [Granulicoccus phenolivorans]|uniref:class I SAM-dependent methyltransferase n=1 Tax=Granulicoccus phenolivorans TaxID=266854 RepID=UPI00040FFA4A|nr:class I SAM-dependent methyltransferase [Granulicoccus phenolivorans]